MAVRRTSGTTEPILDVPLTIDQIKERMNSAGYIKGIVPIRLHHIIDTDADGFLDLISDALTGTELLLDMSYQVVGTLDNDAVLIEVKGDVSMILEEEE
jgi:hypothetical protein